MIILSVPKTKQDIKKNNVLEIAKNLSLIKVTLISPKTKGLTKLENSNDEYAINLSKINSKLKRAKVKAIAEKKIKIIKFFNLKIFEIKLALVTS